MKDERPILPVAAQVERRPAKRFPPAPLRPLGAVWAPRMTEREQQEQQRYIEENNLPF